MSRHNHGTLNEVRLIARLGADPEMRYTPSGIAVATLSVCTQTSWTTSSGEERREVEWHKVTVWGRQAEACNQHLTKGARVEISGSIHLYPVGGPRERREALQCRDPGTASAVPRSPEARSVPRGGVAERPGWPTRAGATARTGG